MNRDAARSTRSPALVIHRFSGLTVHSSRRQRFVTVNAAGNVTRDVRRDQRRSHGPTADSALEQWRAKTPLTQDGNETFVPSSVPFYSVKESRVILSSLQIHVSFITLTARSNTSTLCTLSITGTAQYYCHLVARRSRAKTPEACSSKVTIAKHRGGFSSARRLSLHRLSEDPVASRVRVEN